MRAFAQQRAAFREAAAQEAAGVGHVRAQLLRRAAQHLEDGVERRNVLDAQGGEQRAGLGGEGSHASPKSRRAIQLGDAHAFPGGRRLVGRADPAKCRAELGVSQSLLARSVDQTVVGQDDVGAVGKQELVADGDAPRRDGFHLGKQRFEVHDDAGPDHSRAAANDAGGQKVEREVAIGEFDGVAGVVPAVVAGDDVEPVGEEIDDLPLALVAPLSAEHGQDLHGVLQTVAR